MRAMPADTYIFNCAADDVSHDCLIPQTDAAAKLFKLLIGWNIARALPD